MNKDERINFARKYIEQLQRQKLEARFGPLYEDKLDKRKAEIESQFESIEKYLEKKPYAEGDRLELEALMKNGHFEEQFTKFETAEDRQILNWLSETYQELNQENKVTFPYISTISSSEINAMIDQPEGFDKPYILFTREQLHACHLLTRVFVMSMPIRSKEGDEGFIIEYGIDRIMKYIEEDKLVRLLLFDFFSHSFEQAPGRSVPGAFKNIIIEDIAIYLLTSMELFIFSHEMAHFLNGDPFSTKGLKKEDLWRQESSCDLHGLEQVVKLYQKMGDNEFYLIGPVLYLSYLSLLEMQNKNLSMDDTHPPATKRLDDYCLEVLKFLDEGDESRRFREKLGLVFSVFHSYQQLLFKTK